VSGLVLRVTRLACYLAVTLSLMPVQAVLVVFRSRYAAVLPVFYHRLVCRVMGFEIQVQGQRSIDRPTLFVANHISYLDIEVLGSIIPGCFVAKSEVAGWPLFGWLSKLQRTVFIDRRRRAAAGKHRDSIADRLRAKDNLILFPEGTSGEGARVLPFKSALFSTAEIAIDERPVTVQPVSIAYVRLDGIPLGRHYRPFFAWYGDMDLASHLWQMLGLGRATVVVEFHPPVTCRNFATRKVMSEYCHAVISAGLAAAITGRPQEIPVLAPSSVPRPSNGTADVRGVDDAAPVERHPDAVISA
jgi:1-acyl-sn-glycerol-3-phosphate acyltransferase